MKAVLRLLALATCLTATPASADVLLAGVVRDQDGAAVAGAHVRGFDARQTPIADQRTARDGTFVLSTDVSPTTIRIDCAYCIPQTIAVRAEDYAIAIVRRFGALRDRSPAPADLAALPYRRITDLAALVPFAVTSGSEVSDRGLDRMHGALLVDGVPLYRATDGASRSDLLLPAALVALATQPPLVAPAYGTYAEGGVFDLRTLGTNAVRVDGGTAFDAAAHVESHGVRASVALASDAGDQRRNASAGADLPFAGGTLHATSIVLADGGASLSGAALGYETASRRAAIATDVALRSSNDASLVAARASITSVARVPFTFGVRASRSTGVLADASTGTQTTQAAFVRAATTGERTNLVATVGYERTGDALLFGATRIAGAVGALDGNLALGERFTLHAGIATSLRAPTLLEAESAVAGDRGFLVESGVAYTDNRRIRLRASLFSERLTNPATRKLAGLGVDGTWQIAPALALRAWSLATQATSDGYVGFGGVSRATNRRLVWLTAGNALRVDVLAHGGPLEGDVLVPVGAYAARLGSSIQRGVRVTTFGVSSR